MYLDSEKRENFIGSELTYAGALEYAGESALSLKVIENVQPPYNNPPRKLPLSRMSPRRPRTLANLSCYFSRENYINFLKATLADNARPYNLVLKNLDPEIDVDCIFAELASLL